jgi:hypothetical protein
MASHRFRLPVETGHLVRLGDGVHVVSLFNLNRQSSSHIAFPRLAAYTLPGRSRLDRGRPTPGHPFAGILVAVHLSSAGRL